MDLRLQPGFLGTGASMLADLTLIAYIALLAPAMLVGFFFARQKWFEPHHKMTMTTITVLNWVLILALMIGSYMQGVLPNLASNPSDPRLLLPTLHLVTGALAQLTATYLVIRMWFEDQLPVWFKVQNIKRPMRFTLAAWLTTVLLGVGIYVTWYGGQSTAGSAMPAATQEASTPLENTPDVIPASGTPGDSAPTAGSATPEVTAEAGN